MKNRFIALVFGLFASVAGGQTVRLVAPDYPPYTMKFQETVAGTGMVTITHLFKKAGIPFTAKATSNYTGALSDVTNGEADGFFQAARTPERDSVADYIQIGVNAWSWFFTKASKLTPEDQGFGASARIGTVLNSSQQKWLLEHGYPVHSTPATAVALIKMLETGRIDAAFTSEDVFWYSVPGAECTAGDFRVVEGVRLPTGLYMSKAWIKANPASWKKLKEAAKELPDAK